MGSPAMVFPSWIPCGRSCPADLRQFREVSRKKLLESVKTNDVARIQKKIQKIQKDLEAKQKDWTT